jgi:hypothetical protein
MSFTSLVVCWKRYLTIPAMPPSIRTWRSAIICSNLIGEFGSRQGRLPNTRALNVSTYRQPATVPLRAIPGASEITSSEGSRSDLLIVGKKTDKDNSTPQTQVISSAPIPPRKMPRTSQDIYQCSALHPRSYRVENSTILKNQS